MMPTSTFPQTLAQRTARLQGLHDRLCTTHFGIDLEIRRLLDVFAPWYQFAETQVRPRTIGLWGMTGTGKSSLVHALVKEAGLEDRTLWLDAGESSKENWLGDMFSHLSEHLDGCPFILVVDEFQHARTLRHGEEWSEPGMLRKFWELIDTGRVAHSQDDLSFLKRYIKHLKKAFDAGLEIENGHVVQDAGLLEGIMGPYEFDLEEGEYIPRRVLLKLIENHPEPRPTMAKLKARLAHMKKAELVNWLEDFTRNIKLVPVVDASKILVILLGNLDELYVTGKEPLGELDPDVLLHRHRDIGRSGVQHALSKLFRIEQVGRIGTSHVVFPPIGKQTIDTLIRQEVAKLTQRLSAHCGFAVSVDDGLVDYLRLTSPIAVLGARPVVEAVQNTIPQLLSQALRHPDVASAKSVRIGAKEGRPLVEIEFEEHKHRMELAWDFQVANVLPDRTKIRERVSVHEVGHLLCGVLLRGKRPLQVCVSTRDQLMQGFVAWDSQWDQPFLRSEIVPELAALLGGRVAEYLHYGPDEICAGVEDDLRKATELALDMVKHEGMGPFWIHHEDHHGSHGMSMRTMLPEMEAQAKQWIEAAKTLAKDTLQEHQALFTRIVEALMQKGSLGPTELGRLLERYTISQ